MCIHTNFYCKPAALFSFYSTLPGTALHKLRVYLSIYGRYIYIYIYIYIYMCVCVCVCIYVLCNL